MPPNTAETWSHYLAGKGLQIVLLSFLIAGLAPARPVAEDYMTHATKAAPEAVKLDVVLHAIRDRNALLIDTRMPARYLEAHIPTAISADDLVIAPVNKECATRLVAASIIIVYGASERSVEPYMMADRLAAEYGVKVYIYAAGWKEWAFLSLEWNLSR